MYTPPDGYLAKYNYSKTYVYYPHKSEDNYTYWDRDHNSISTEMVSFSITPTLVIHI